jgi:hypothetical protein
MYSTSQFLALAQNIQLFFNCSASGQGFLQIGRVNKGAYEFGLFFLLFNMFGLIGCWHVIVSDHNRDTIVYFYSYSSSKIMPCTSRAKFVQTYPYNWPGNTEHHRWIFLFSKPPPPELSGEWSTDAFSWRRRTCAHSLKWVRIKGRGYPSSV